MDSKKILGTGRAFAATLFLALAAGGLLAGEKLPEFQATAEHEILKAAEGEWEMRFADGSRGSSTAAVGLLGQWLVEEVEAEFHGQAYRGRSVTSYDPATKKYVNVWIDSTSPRPLVTEGEYDKKTKTITFSGEMRGPTGELHPVRLVTVYGEKGRSFAMKAAGPKGAEMELVRIVYEQKAR